MVQLQGTAQNVRTDQEQSRVVLRFVMVTDGEQAPVEMRGAQLLGVLNSGDRVLIEGRRDRDGVIRPQIVRNVSTNSIVQMRGPSPLSAFASFVLSAVFAVFTGALSTVLVGLVGMGAEGGEVALGVVEMVPGEGGEVIPYIAEEAVTGGSVAVQVAAIIVGLVVAAIVFYLVYIRPRRKRRA